MEIFPTELINCDYLLRNVKNGKKTSSPAQHIHRRAITRSSSHGIRHVLEDLPEHILDTVLISNVETLWPTQLNQFGAILTLVRGCEQVG